MTIGSRDFTALILAGSRQGIDPMATTEGYRHKALIEVDGRPMLTRVVEAVKAAGAARVIVSCDHPDVTRLALDLGADVAAPADRPSLSILRATEGIDYPVVVTTADHALLKPDWVRYMLAECSPDADFGVMLANRHVIERDVPGTRRTYARFRDGDWSGCNLFLLQTPGALRAVELWQDVEQDRKRPWKVAALLGFGNLFAYLSGRLTAAEALGRLGAQVQCVVGTVPAASGFAAVDVDKPEDLAEVRRIVAYS